MTPLKEIAAVLLTIILAPVLIVGPALMKPMPGHAAALDAMVKATPRENRAEMKSDVIIGKGIRGTFQRAVYKIEVRSVKKIPGGVEIMARAWKGGEPVGFGKDGTVEIERFRIFNPPVLVSDPAGPIERQSKDADGNPIFSHFREDPEEALMLTLEHTMRVAAKSGENIVKGKVGNTTDTYYPAAGTVDPVDGRVARTGANESWATIRSGAGNETDSSVEQQATIQERNSASSPNFSQLHRLIFGWDTSGIADTDTIDSATVSLYGYTKNQGLSVDDTVYIDRRDPATDSAVAASDFNIAGWDGAAQSDTAIAVSAWNTGGYNDFALNATGLANISKTGRSWYGLRFTGDRTNSSPGYVGSGSNNNVGVDMADITGTANDPKLVVTHTAAAAGGPVMLMSHGF